MSSGPSDLPEVPSQATAPSTALDILPRPMVEQAASTLDGLVEPERRVEAAERVLSSLRAKPVAAVTAAQMTVTATHTQYQGFFPPADMIAGYEQARSGLGERVIAMAEADQRATIASNTLQQWFDFFYKVLALLAGVGSLFGILWYVAHLATGDHDWLATSVVAAFGTGLIVAIINARIGKPETGAAAQPPAVLVPTDGDAAVVPTSPQPPPTGQQG